MLFGDVLVAAISAWLGGGPRPTDSAMTPSTLAVAALPSWEPPAVVHDPYTGPVQLENATLLVLCRNWELYDLLETIHHYESRFNHRYHYPWTFLNDVPFSLEFRAAVQLAVSGKAHFGHVPEHHWGYPDWINQTYAAEVRERMVQDDVIYGGLELYRHMCRFNLGFFFHHRMTQRFRYYWRVEPGTKIMCDLHYDVFRFMREHGKRYGFAILLYEYQETIQTLWPVVSEFIRQNRELVNWGEDNLHAFAVDPGYDSTETGRDIADMKYNLCHFWTNFEIGDMDFFRGEAYTRFFEYLDESGGFYYERWGDAPVHLLAVALFMDRSDVHWFGDIGYYHTPYLQCPLEFDVRIGRKCSCDPRKDFSREIYSCTGHLLGLQGMSLPDLSV